ncbi:MAG: DUF1015 domain-containing protein [Methanomassiliicoccales archaeon]|nr:MAG: DUF1015 domain-containing protein [Methanomassiliicoccales archaeon]
MVEFLPFRGLIPSLKGNEKIDDRVSPPYDVISPEQLVRYRSSPFNVTNITLGGNDGDYSEAGRRLESWLSGGHLVQEPEPYFYLYEQEFLEDGVLLNRKGLVGVLKAEGYSPDGVIPHEETFSNVKEDRLNLLKGTETHCESIFGLVDEMSFLNSISPEKMFEFRDEDGVSHRMYRIHSQHDIDMVRTALSKKRMLIADGHHRYETACRYALENPRDPLKGYVLATIVSTDDPGLVVRPTHRLVGGMNIEDEQLLVALSLDFALSRATSLDDLLERMRSSGGRDLGLYTRSGMSILLRPKSDGEGALGSLDAYKCEELIIKPLVHRRKGWRVAYDHDSKSAAERTRRGDYDFAILLSAPRLSTIWEVAMSSKKMPKKSTYFWPKIWSGLVYYRMK